MSREKKDIKMISKHTYTGRLCWLWINKADIKAEWL